MTIPFFCLVFAMFMLLITKAPVALAMARSGGYDNHHPRDQQDRLKGWGKRALAAHKNEMEAFPIFAAAVIMAHLYAPDSMWAPRLAITFIVARMAYMVLYIVNWDILRSLVWGLGYGCCILLALLPTWS